MDLNAQMVLVSVIVPTHNRPDLLARTLKSILNQTFSNLQIIVVSNGMSPQNKKAASKFNDKRIEYYDQENTGGPSAPRNLGIEKAKGEFLAFCDDDDIWMPEKIKKQINLMQKNSRLGLCFTKMKRFDEDKEWWLSHESGHANFNSLLYVNTVPISSVMVRKTLLANECFFSESKKVGPNEDYEFLLRCAQVTKFGYLDEFLIKYWSGGNRTTSLYRRDFQSIFYYYISMLNIYLMVYKKGKSRFKDFLGPVFFLSFTCFKQFTVTLLQRLNFRK